MTTSAIERRRERGAAVAAAHPRWHGIQHPELIVVPPRRFSQLDMLPAVERAAAPRSLPRAERSRAIVAAHPRWHGIKHLERLVFSDLPSEDLSLLSYRAAVRLALAHLQESEQLCRRIDAVAASIHRRSWPWAAAPASVPARPLRRSRPRLALGYLAARLARLRERLEHGPGLPGHRLLPH
jgi:hypothetical protein